MPDFLIFDAEWPHLLSHLQTQNFQGVLPPELQGLLKRLTDFQQPEGALGMAAASEFGFPQCNPQPGALGKEACEAGQCDFALGTVAASEFGFPQSNPWPGDLRMDVAGSESGQYDFALGTVAASEFGFPQSDPPRDLGKEVASDSEFSFPRCDPLPSWGPGEDMVVSKTEEITALTH